LSDLLLDTHIALWLVGKSTRLRSGTVDLIERCWQTGGKLYFSSVSAWEVAMLVSRGRLTLTMPAGEWVERILNWPGVEGVALSFGAAANSYGMEGLDNGDPADRLMVATAVELGCKMVTYDARVIAFAEGFGERYGFGVVF